MDDLICSTFNVFLIIPGTHNSRQLFKLLLPNYISYYYTDIPQLSSVPILAPSSTSIIVSWTPTEFTPSSYRVDSSCQLICGSSPEQQTDIVSGSLTEHTISSSITPGSTCTVSVIAVFGSSIMSITIMSSNNTLSAGTLQ